jgi:hypothetical protein
MSLELRRRMDLTAPQIAGLESAMAAFYSDPPPTYYQIADESTGKSVHSIATWWTACEPETRYWN